MQEKRIDEIEAVLRSVTPVQGGRIDIAGAAFLAGRKVERRRTQIWRVAVVILAVWGGAGFFVGRAGWRAGSSGEGIIAVSKTDDAARPVISNQSVLRLQAVVGKDGLAGLNEHWVRGTAMIRANDAM
jgi:hypothetical protein